PTSILDRFIEHSMLFQDAPAIFIDDRSYTYGELRNVCSSICVLLRDHGIEKGDRVGILTENNIYTYASLFGILACGACYVPLNPANPVQRNMGIIGDAGLELLLYTDKQEEARQLSVSPVSECRPVINQVPPTSRKLEPLDQAPD